MENLILHSLVEKIVSGKKNWTPEELQYQKNHPDEVEKALHEYRKTTEILDRIMVVHYDCNFLQMKKAMVGISLKPKFLSFPEAVALAVTVSDNNCKETNMVIVTVVADMVDLALITIGDGVYEIRYTNCVSSISAEKMYRLWYETQLVEPKVDRLLIATIGDSYFHYKTLFEKLFGVQAENMYNLQELVQRGRVVQAGVMTGEIKDVLLLSVMPQTIGIEMEEGLMFPLIEANTTIPTRVSKSLYLDAGAMEFRVDVMQGNDYFSRKNDLVGTLCLNNPCCQQDGQREMELMVDIDSCGCCVCRLTDKKYNVTTELKLL